MRSWTANGNTRLLAWQRVREFAVPPVMIETATARRLTGDWAGACAAARVDADLNPRAVVPSHGREVASRLRADLRHLAPDLLRWHLPRVAPDGLLRPGLTVSLAVYHPPGARPLHLVARTAPAWADAGQRISLALWERSGPDSVDPHPRPDRRFRLDLHRHLWDARRAGELWQRSRPDLWPGAAHAVHRWAGEARLMTAADGLADGPVVLRLGAGRRLLLDPDGRTARLRSRACGGLPILPDAAIRVPPDLELLRAGLIGAGRLHPLVAAALAPGRHPPATAARAARPAAVPALGSSGTWVVQCRGAQHRIGLVDGALAPLDHDPAELRREEMLTALGGTPMPCLRAVDAAIRHPESLSEVRARLDHGDYDGAMRAVERLLGPSVTLRDGALRDELDAAVERRLTHSLFRAGLTGYGPPRHADDQRLRRTRRSHPRQALPR
jgi:hypothetical protein